MRALMACSSEVTTDSVAQGGEISAEPPAIVSPAPPPAEVPVRVAETSTQLPHTPEILITPAEAPVRVAETSTEVCGAKQIATVTHVFDGDTVGVRFPDGHEDTVRYIGVDTPELGEDCASEATAFQRTLVAGKELHLLRDVRDRDIYGRLLRYACTADRVFVNAELVAAGYAHAVRYPPDTRFASTFERLEDQAAVAGRGCLHRAAQTGAGADGSLCCKICRNGKPCGDTCVPFDRRCAAAPGCACSG